MYFGGLDVEAAARWLHGFEAALQVLFDLDVDFGSREDVWQSHGLELGGSKLKMPFVKLATSRPSEMCSMNTQTHKVRPHHGRSSSI
jgi:hypothetical protein